jgi:hypothetical protein
MPKFFPASGSSATLLMMRYWPTMSESSFWLSVMADATPATNGDKDKARRRIGDFMAVKILFGGNVVWFPSKIYTRCQ